MSGGDWPGRMICCPKDLHRFLTIGEEKSSPCICLPDLRRLAGVAHVVLPALIEYAFAKLNRARIEDGRTLVESYD